MREIADEMQRSTDALVTLKISPDILDICMTPGEILGKILEFNTTAEAMAFSLPATDGGYKVLLPRSPSVTTKFLDVTKLATDMDFADEDLETGQLLPRQLDEDQRFDLIVCDGQILRTHVQSESHSATKITTTQLVMARQRVKTGGTMIVLLHKVENVHNIALFHTFSRFAIIRLFKPTKRDAKRSSFYMVATNIKSDHPVAVLAAEKLKKQRKFATFGTDEGYSEHHHAVCLHAEELLRDVGPERVKL